MSTCIPCMDGNHRNCGYGNRVDMLECRCDRRTPDCPGQVLQQSGLTFDQAVAVDRTKLNSQPVEETMCNCADSAEQLLEPLPHPIVVNIQSGDVLVVRANKVIPSDRIKSQLDVIAPGANVLVIDDGAELTHILRPSE